MDRLLRWVDQEIDLPLLLTLHSVIFVALVLGAFLFWHSLASSGSFPRSCRERSVAPDRSGFTP
jgi:hypothetical protein